MAETYELTQTVKFDIVKTFECGQCFRWNADEVGVYTGVVRGVPARLWNEGRSVFIRTEPGSIGMWREYFDLERDYAGISKNFEIDEYMTECCRFGAGIRILRQEPWETLCSFIISQCNNIPRIKGIVEALCRNFGDPVVFEGSTLFAFPPAASLAALEPDELAPLRCGYRAPYIIAAARAVADGSADLEAMAKATHEDALAELKKLPGVGDKVANCIVLFGLGITSGFPVDVWMKKALSEHFETGFDPKVFGEFAGLAQQYIFYYARSTGREK